MTRLFNEAVELDQPSAVESAIHVGRDYHGRLLPGSRMTPTRYRPDGQCQGFECKNIVKGGLVLKQQKLYFCCQACDTSYENHRYVCGTCEQCGGTIMGGKSKIGKRRFCCREHEKVFTADRMFADAGPLRKPFEDYIATTNRYKPSTLAGVKVTMSHFGTHVVSVEGVKTLAEITSSMVTRFIAAEKTRGMTSANYVGHISTFFKCHMANNDNFLGRNPVIPYIHSQKSNPAVARPYAERDLTSIWDIVNASNNTMLKLAFAIGEECGLRIGEVCNIRLEDVDHGKQTIFVRLPTKNMDVRTVPFHDKVKLWLQLWLEERSPKCEHDRLLYTKQRAVHRTSSLDSQFAKFFASEEAPARGFSFHRLRHSWATRLMNNGMELAVLKELGGWKSWNSMQRYIKVLPDTVRSQYEAAYRKIQEQPKQEREAVLSLLDFAMLADPEETPVPAKAA